jgi:signal transduction histidine kinase
MSNMVSWPRNDNERFRRAALVWNGEEHDGSTTEIRQLVESIRRRPELDAEVIEAMRRLTYDSAERLRTSE